MAEDSIEHYARCKSVRKVANQFLALTYIIDFGIEPFMLLTDALEDADTLVCVAILVYATYTATNTLSNEGASLVPSEDACEMLKQCCRNAVLGHSGSCKVLDSRWVRLRNTRARFD